MSRHWPALSIASADDLVQAALVDHDVAAVEDLESSLRVFFHTPATRDAAVIGLRQLFPDIRIEPVDVPDEDWAARSQAGLKAVHVGRLIIAPPWDVDNARRAGLETNQPRPAVIVIEPSMGFGTGHHATTRLCLAALQQIELAGKSVVDVGTGSGVLAIAASLLGAGDVVGLDDDPDALQAAGDNVTLNADARVRLQLGDLRLAALSSADVVTANLTGGLLTAEATRLVALAVPGGTLILSGLLASEEAAVVSAFNPGGPDPSTGASAKVEGPQLQLERRAQEEEWVCVTLRRRMPS